MWSADLKVPVKHLDGATIYDAPRVCGSLASGIKAYVIRDRHPSVSCICQCPPVQTARVVYQSGSAGAVCERVGLQHSAGLSCLTCFYSCVILSRGREGRVCMSVRQIAGMPLAFNHPANVCRYTCSSRESDSRPSYHAAAAVDRSMTSGCPAVGTPTATGFVPKMGSVLPCGATYSGDWLMAMPIKPC